jgi:pimeloyl-ACP methyl ester carboxylesterase
MQAGILGKAMGLLGSSQGQAGHVPLPIPSASFCLPNGSWLAYDEFGTRQDFPLIYFHDAGSSRLECAHFHRAAVRHGYRLIAIDRPGIGCSQFYPLQAAADFAADVVVLADHLGLQNFGVIALGAGGIYAATLAYQVPERVAAVLSIGGIPGVAFNESPPDSFIASCLQELTPACVQLITRIRHTLFPDDPELATVQLESMLSVTDRKSLALPKVRQLLALDHRETLRQGARGVAQDFGVCYRKFDFHLSSISVPTIIWQGAADRLSSRAESEFLVSRIPDATYYRVANRGHFFFIHCMDEVFDRLRLSAESRARLAA